MTSQEPSHPLLSEARRSLVTDMLQTAGAVTIGELQERFGVSSMTARRDLTILADRGIAKRTHGGAVLPAMAAQEHSFSRQLRAAPEAELRLAEAAFTLIGPGETLFLDASSASFFLAREIRERGLAVRVVTNSLPVLHELSASESSDIEIMAIGGTFRRLTSSYVGPAAVRAARDVFADRFFGSVIGVAPNGVLTDADGLEAEVKRTMLEQCEQSILLLDPSKLTTHGHHAVAPIGELSLVLGCGLEPADADALVANGAALQIVTAPVPARRFARFPAAPPEG